jgi:hypothetical protein
MTTPEPSDADGPPAAAAPQPVDYEAPDVVTVVYRHAFRALEWRGLRALPHWLAGVLRRCTPAFADPFRLPPGPPRRGIDAAILAATMFLCLGMTGALAAVSGTWWPAGDVKVLHWASDRWNIVLYAVVCPAYVLLCLRLLILAIERPPAESAVPAPPPVLRLFVSIFLIVLFSSLLITSYVADAADPVVTARRYWFFDESNGVRVLNAAGLYYIVLNFSLLVTTFVGGASFIAVSIDGMALARTLTADAPVADFDQFRQRIERLVRAYRLGVWLVFWYAVNLIVWKFSPLGQGANLQIAGALFTLIGLFFVAVPRRFVQHVWAGYCARRAAASGQPCSDEVYQDVIATRDRRVIGLLQLLCIGGWFDVFYEVPLNPAHYLGLLFGAG